MIVPDRTNWPKVFYLAATKLPEVILLNLALSDLFIASSLILEACFLSTLVMVSSFGGSKLFSFYNYSRVGFLMIGWIASLLSLNSSIIIDLFIGPPIEKNIFSSSSS